VSKARAKKDQPYSSLLRGVDALLGEDRGAAEVELNDSPEVAAEVIPLNQIDLPESQPRKYFNPEKLEELAASIREHDVITPIVVRPTGRRFELVAGERRFRAAKIASLKQIPAVIKTLDDDQALQVALVENLQREDLNPVEETEAILQLLSIRLARLPKEVIALLYRMQNETKGKVTQNVLGNAEGRAVLDVFENLGIIAWESFVSVRLPLLKLPSDVLDNIREGKLAYTKAQAIAKVKDPEQRQELMGSAIGESLSLSQIKNRVKDVATESSVGKQQPILKTRVDSVYRSLRKSKAWEHPKKAKRLEKLLSSLEQLLEED